MRSLLTSKSLCHFLLVLLLLLSGCIAKTPTYNMPTSIDNSQKYLFFLHGTITERQGAYGTHPIHGTYNYHKMVEALSNRGLTVISEVRARDTNIKTYARKVTGQVNTLLAQGVLPEHISIVGFSKGGAITLRISSLLKNPKINFVILAGCGNSGMYRIGYEKFLERDAFNLQGRILSLYDTKDSLSGSCVEAFDLAAGDISSNEIQLNVGEGHSTFYRPRKEWLTPVVEWITESE